MNFLSGNLPLTWRLVLLSGISLLCVTIISTLVARDLMRSEFDQIRDRELQLMTDHILAELARVAAGAPGNIDDYGSAAFPVKSSPAHTGASSPNNPARQHH